MGDKRGINRLIAALGYSWAGLRATFASEVAFRQELLLCAILVPLACYLDIDGVERALMLASLLLLLITELINTAIEAIIERISTEIHPLSKKAKDIGSAAVLLALLLMITVWSSVLARFL